mgnify:CR=1 FL=1
MFPMPVRLEDSPIGRGPCEAALRADPPDPGADGDAELRFFMQVKETALSKGRERRQGKGCRTAGEPKGPGYSTQKAAKP